MSVYHILIINRAGSLIFDYENKPNEPILVERTFNYPLGIALEVMDQKPTVIFGSRDDIYLRYTVVSVNGRPLKGQYLSNDGGDESLDFIKFIEKPENFPMTIVFSPPVLTANEKIVLSSMFHSLYTIAAQLSPVTRSSGIEVIETNQFRLHCFQSITGVKFLVIAAPSFTLNLEVLLRKVYELYADFALKNPFYSIDMPIRAEKFEEALRALLEKHEKYSLITL